jgi:hypothetical protein
MLREEVGPGQSDAILKGVVENVALRHRKGRIGNIAAVDIGPWESEGGKNG